MIEWKDSMSVGIKVIDDDHKILLGLLNQCLEAMESGKTLSIQSVFRELERYTHYHFAREEDLMARCGYDDLDVHHETHEAMCDTLHNMADEVLYGADEETEAEIKAFLNSWLFKHIMGEDFQYRESMSRLDLG